MFIISIIKAMTLSISVSETVLPIGNAIKEQSLYLDMLVFMIRDLSIETHGSGDMDISILILSLVLFVLLNLSILFIAVYNRIVRNTNSVQRGWAAVVSFEQQKVKIISNLERTLKGYLSHESSVFKQITQLRSAIPSLSTDSTDTDTLSAIEKQSREVVQGLNVAVENYPDLKASAVCTTVMKELTDQEEEVGAAIRAFNQTVEVFNNSLQIFPNNIVNVLLNRQKRIKPYQDPNTDAVFSYTPF
ncbi:LemA family protein [Gynuella sunshinyii]|nr:LemA family protein [Gynuella sunshinyii]